MIDCTFSHLRKGVKQRSGFQLAQLPEMPPGPATAPGAHSNLPHPDSRITLKSITNRVCVSIKTRTPLTSPPGQLDGRQETGLRRILSIDSHLLTSFTNFLWKLLTFTFNWKWGNRKAHVSGNSCHRVPAGYFMIYFFKAGERQ